MSHRVDCEFGRRRLSRHGWLWSFDVGGRTHDRAALGAAVHAHSEHVSRSVLEDLSDASSETVEVAERITTTLAPPFPIDGGRIMMSASVGATVAKPDESADDLVRRADRAMYAARNAGRGRFHLE